MPDSEAVQAPLISEGEDTYDAARADGEAAVVDAGVRGPRDRANELDGKAWTRYSISIWHDLRKTQEEIALRHPAMFPLALPRRLIESLTNRHQRVVLDPFAGVGTTVIAAHRLGKDGVGIEISAEYAEKARRGWPQTPMFQAEGGSATIHTADAMDLLQCVDEESVDLVVTSPPYWDILSQKRTADGREIRDYGETPGDLAKVSEYGDFLEKLKAVFAEVYKAMRPGAYCCVIVMDIRKKARFYPFHSDIAAFMQHIGFLYDDIIIWDRGHEYSNLRPLGYPYVFRVNKIHEFILIFLKPNDKPDV